MVECEPNECVVLSIIYRLNSEYFRDGNSPSLMAGGGQYSSNGVIRFILSDNSVKDPRLGFKLDH